MAKQKLLCVGRASQVRVYDKYDQAPDSRGPPTIQRNASGRAWGNTMPLLKKQIHVPQLAVPAGTLPSSELFVCRWTGEVFADYQLRAVRGEQPHWGLLRSKAERPGFRLA